jgi:hypothetical protein
MKVTPIDHGLTHIGKSTGHRSEGLHMSQIYGALYQKMYPKVFQTDRPMNPLHLEMGLAWENMLEDGLRQRLVQARLENPLDGEDAERPGEFVTEEGIYFSPDLIVYNGATRLGEIKLTWMSMREMPMEPGEEFPSKPQIQKWLTQMKAYCYHLGTPYARLYGFFINGEYAWMKKAKGARPVNPEPGGPQLRAWDIEFSERELRDEWEMLKNFAYKEGMLA